MIAAAADLDVHHRSDEEDPALARLTGLPVDSGQTFTAIYGETVAVWTPVNP